METTIVYWGYNCNPHSARTLQKGSPIDVSSQNKSDTVSIEV